VVGVDVDGVDVDDTTRCPVRGQCESCDRPGVPCWEERGSGESVLWVLTADSGMGGVFCMTLCGACSVCPLPSFGVLGAATRVAEHCEHLGINLDEMARLVESGRA